MKILVIGKSGQLGADLVKVGALEHDMILPDRSELDICNSIDLKQIEIWNPELIINTAAFHNVPLCEIEYEMAFRTNCIAVRNLARVSAKIGARFITFSTDYVFAGAKQTLYTEEDNTEPLQVYGITKRAGECAAISVAPEYTFIIRTCGLYGENGSRSKHGNFVKNRLKDAADTGTIEIGADQRITPTYTYDLAQAVFQLLTHSDADSGIYHLTNEGDCNWYEFTKEIYKIKGIGKKVIPTDRKGLSGSMRRPLYSVLENSRAKKLGILMPHWKNALKRYLTCSE